MFNVTVTKYIAYVVTIYFLSTFFYSCEGARCVVQGQHHPCGDGPANPALRLPVAGDDDGENKNKDNGNDCLARVD